MNGRHLTDAQISQALRAHLPERAQAGLREKVLEAAETATQQRPMPLSLAALTDADPAARRRSLLLAAALLVALTLGLAAGVGAWLDSQKRERDLLLLLPPGNVDLYVIAAYEGVVDLPALTITIMEVEGTKARFFYNGAGIIRHDHYSSPNDPQPSEYRLFSDDQMAERADLNGQAVWLKHDQQGNPLGQLVFATGLKASCEPAWEYVGLEYRIGRPTHHVACGASAMWMDVETRLPLKSINAQGGDLPTITFEVLELQVGPQPPELFDPPAGLTSMGDLEYNCALDPTCASPATSVPTDPPVVSPRPAPDDLAAPPDVDALVAEVLATYPTLPALEMLVEVDGDARRRLVYDGSGRTRMEWYFDPNEPPTVFINKGGRTFESYGLTSDGRTLWQDRPEAAWKVEDFGISQRCRVGWEHQGYDLVNDRPAHHLVCGHLEYWVDREWLLAVRSQQNPDPLSSGTHFSELLALQFLSPRSELFELPDDAVVCQGSVRRGTCVDENGNPVDPPSPSPSPSPSG